MLWTGRNIQQFLRKVMEGVAAGDAEADKAADELPELHATCVSYLARLEFQFAKTAPGRG